jgi:hypothetical protein
MPVKTRVKAGLIASNFGAKGFLKSLIYLTHGGAAMIAQRRTLEEHQHTIIPAASKPACASQVRVFDGETAESLPAPLGSITAFTQNPIGEVRVPSCDLNSNGTDDIIVSPGPGKAPEMRVFDGGPAAAAVRLLPRLQPAVPRRCLRRGL